MAVVYRITWNLYIDVEVILRAVPTLQLTVAWVARARVLAHATQMWLRVRKLRLQQGFGGQAVAFHLLVECGPIDRQSVGGGLAVPVVSPQRGLDDTLLGFE